MNSENKKYGNCKVFSPEGKLMFLCNSNRAKWYLDRELAVSISEEEIQLTFTPKGLGYSNDGGDYFFTPKEDRCVCCGTTEMSKLTRHHIVPYCYRKYMPDDYKNHNCYDVVKLCRECHNSYEIHAQELKFKIADDLGVNINKKSVVKVSFIKGYANILLNHLENLPDHVFEKMYNEISEYLGQAYLSNEELRKIAKMNYNEDPEWKSWGEECVEKLDNLDDFIKMWRLHFLENTKPQFMHQGWEVDKNYTRKLSK